MKTFRNSCIAFSAVMLLALLFLSPQIAYYTPTNDVDIVIFLCIAYGVLFSAWCLAFGVAFLGKRFRSSCPGGAFMQRLMQITELTASNVWVPVLSVLMVLTLLLYGLFGNHYYNAGHGFLRCSSYKQSICDKHGNTIVDGKEDFRNAFDVYLNSQTGEPEILRLAEYNQFTSSKFVTTFDKEGHELKNIRIDFYSREEAEEKGIKERDIAEVLCNKYDINASISSLLYLGYIKEITDLTSREVKADSHVSDNDQRSNDIADSHDDYESDDDVPVEIEDNDHTPRRRSTHIEQRWVERRYDCPSCMMKPTICPHCMGGGVDLGSSYGTQCFHCAGTGKCLDCRGTGYQYRQELEFYEVPD